MLKTTSRDGNFIISAPENAKTGCPVLSNGENEEQMFDKIQDVYLEVVKGRKVNLVDLAEAISSYCFPSIFGGNSCLNLLAKELRCHVKSGEKEYEFTVPWLHNDDAYIHALAVQIEL